MSSLNHALLGMFLIGFVAVGSNTAPAYAGPCSDEIVRLQTLMRGNDSNPNIGPTAQQSVAAQMHRQPTADSVARAKTKADAKVEDALKRARLLDVRGKEDDCMKAVEEAKALLGL
jgi:hypothetical protein